MTENISYNLSIISMPSLLKNYKFIILWWVIDYNVQDKIPEFLYVIYRLEHNIHVASLKI